MEKHTYNICYSIKIGRVWTTLDEEEFNGTARRLATHVAKKHKSLSDKIESKYTVYVDITDLDAPREYDEPFEELEDYDEY